MFIVVNWGWTYFKCLLIESGYDMACRTHKSLYKYKHKGENRCNKNNREAQVFLVFSRLLLDANLGSQERYSIVC